MNILITNGHIIDPANKVDGKFDLLVADGKIAKLGTPGSLPKNGVEAIDASGMIVVPGLIDLHVHLREPGYEYKETVATGTAAAKAGGFTAVCCMPNTNPVNDCRSVTDLILAQAAKAGSARVFPIGAITKGSRGEALAGLFLMAYLGITVPVVLLGILVQYVATEPAMLAFGALLLVLLGVAARGVAGARRTA